MDLPERYAMLCGTFWKGVPSGTKGAPSIDLIWVPLSDVLLQDSKCAPSLRVSPITQGINMMRRVPQWWAQACSL